MGEVNGVPVGINFKVGLIHVGMDSQTLRAVYYDSAILEAKLYGASDSTTAAIELTDEQTHRIVSICDEAICAYKKRLKAVL